MGRNRLFPLAVILVAVPLLGPIAARAQRGARFSPSPASSVRHNSTMMSSAHMRTSRRATTGFDNGFTNGFFSNSLGLGQVSFFPNPSMGLGINGINTIATQDIGTLAAIDPATQWRLALAERVARSVPGIFGGSGFFLLDGGAAYALPAEAVQSEQPPQQQQQPVIVVQQAPAQQQQAPPAVSEQPAAPPVPDAGQFTLVLHNGAQVEAVAFTHMKDRIVYIARDGSRRTMALSDLDADATVRLNQERGTPLQLPL
jgi:hypothetical protein